MAKLLPGDYTLTQEFYYALFDELPKRDIENSNLPELIEIIDGLGEQTAKVVKMRFGLGCDSMTRKATANEFHLSIERIRQVENKALRMLKHPTRKSRIKRLFSSVNELLCLIREQDAQISDLQEKLQALDEENHRLRNLHDLIDGRPGFQDSVDVLRLSARSRHCLCRAGIDTIDELVVRYYHGKLPIIRNLGRKSIEEIEAKLRKIGAIPNTEKNE